MAAINAKFRVCSKLLLLLLFVSSFLSASSFDRPHLVVREALTSRRVLEAELDEALMVKKTTTKSKKVKNDTISVDEHAKELADKPKKVKSYAADGDKHVVKPKKVKNDEVSRENEVKTKVKSDAASSEAEKKMKKTEEVKNSKLTKTISKTPIEESSSVSDLAKQSPPKNKTKTVKSKKATESGSKSKGGKSQKKPSWMEEDDIDIVDQMRDFQSKFSQSIIPDMERISHASRKYFTKANKEMIRGIRPIVGYKYASTIASFVSFAFVVIPLLLVPLIFNRIKTYFSLQKILIFIQAYLAIYFSILCLSSLVTGIDPLKFFYATSTSTYLCVMVLQTLAYVLYLLMLLMYLILVFSTETSTGSKLMGLGQAGVGFLVGLHFYMAVFHRVVLQQPPMTNWKSHAAYAACFMVLCGFAAAEKRKKTYLEEGGDVGKNN